MYRRYSDELIASAMADVRAGMTDKEVGKKYQCHPSTVHYWYFHTRDQMQQSQVPEVPVELDTLRKENEELRSLVVDALLKQRASGSSAPLRI